MLTGTELQGWAGAFIPGICAPRGSGPFQQAGRAAGQRACSPEAESGAHRGEATLALVRCRWWGLGWHPCRPVLTSQLLPEPGNVDTPNLIKLPSFPLEHDQGVLGSPVSPPEASIEHPRKLVFQ